MNGRGCARLSDPDSEKEKGQPRGKTDCLWLTGLRERQWLRAALGPAPERGRGFAGREENILNEEIWREKLPDNIAYNKMNPALSIFHPDSTVAALYHIKTPFLVTLETCSGTGPDDYINFLTLSSRESYFHQETAQHHHQLYTDGPPHFHDYFELMIVLEGNITQKVDDQLCPYPAGSCCLVNRSLLHKEDFNSRAQVLFLGLSAEFAEELFDSCRLAWYREEQSILDSEFCRFVQRDLQSPGQKAYLDYIPAWQNSRFPVEFHNIATELLTLLFHPSFGATLRLKGLICSILAYLSSPSHYHCTCVTLDSSSDFLLFARITHLMEESSGRLGRTELSQALNYSGDYLNRIVRKYTGMCLFDYGMTFCLKKAADCLSNSRDSISAIAAQLHFTNRTHFYSLFKKQFGMTPKEYRERHISTASIK